MNTSKALQSSYLNYKFNENIPFYNGRAKLFVQENKIEVEVSVFLQWLPTPTVRFNGNIISSKINLIKFNKASLGKEQKIVFPDTTECGAYIQNITLGNRNMIEGAIRDFSSNKQAEVNCISFSIVNFLDCLGRYVETEERGYLGRLNFRYKEWKITIDKRFDYNLKPEKIMKELKDKGGFLITHLGRIERTDGRNFDTNEVDHVIRSLNWLLSFASGRHVGISLLEGKYHGEVVWFDNDIQIISPWKNNLTWFPKQKGEVLEDLFPVVAEKFENVYLAKVLRESLSWYIECYSKSIIESKIVSAQTVLEMLSWSYLVIYSNKLSKTQFKKNNTSDNIRILLRNFQIGTSYSFVPELQNLEFDDGVHLLIEARNNAVHPVAKEEYDGGQKYMILQIGLQYIELVLLGIFKYDQYFLNNLKQPIREGNYEIVPWSQGVIEH